MDWRESPVRSVRPAALLAARPAESISTWPVVRLIRRWIKRDEAKPVDKLPRLPHLAVTAALLVSLAGPAVAVRAAPRLQPQLAALSAELPVRVIVQKAERSGAAEALAAQLGGTVTADFAFINAFAASLTAGAARQLAASPAVRWVSLDGAMQTSGGPGQTKFTTWATKVGAVVANGFTNAANAVGPAGPNGTFASGGRVKGAFSGFVPEYTPGMYINRVELTLRGYASGALGSTEIIKVTPYVGGVAGAAVAVPYNTFNACVGTTAAAACTQRIDITAARAWTWADFATLEVVVDQAALAKTRTLTYDAVGLRVTALPGSDASTPFQMTSSGTETAVATNNLTNVFPASVRATEVWNTAPYRQGAGVTVAVVDSGSFKTNGLGTRLIGDVNFNSAEHTSNDQYGHGSHVTGLIADDGSYSSGKYMGIAPKANILGVRVSDDAGMATESDVVSGLQWVYTNRAAYNIKVVNLSLNAAVYQSYNTSPLCAAVEILWFSGVTVVVSAGNNGTATLYPPANDPFVITVGAVDDKNTASLADDTLATYSAYGTDEAGGAKPDLVAPGRSLIAYLPDNPSLTISVQHPEARVDANYFRMSGTSMAAPVVSGAAALLLQDEPGLTPDQVKYRLKATANRNWAGYSAATAGAGTLDAYAAVFGTTTANANTGLTVSRLLTTGTDPVNSSVSWNSVSWNSVSWNSVSWNSVSWNSVSWNSVSWNSDYWGP